MARLHAAGAFDAWALTQSGGLNHAKSGQTIQTNLNSNFKPVRIWTDPKSTFPRAKILK
jgi:hypothetical protein